MAGITLEQAETRLNEYLAAEAAVLSGQAYELGGRMLRRADLEFIQIGIQTWDTRVKELAAAAESSTGRTRRSIIPRPGW